MRLLRWHWWIISACLFAGFALAAGPEEVAVGPEIPMARIARKNFDRIPAGATETDVKAIIGLPQGAYFLSERPSIWQPIFVAGDRMEGVPSSDPTNCRAWMSDTSLILVHLRGRRVAEKAFFIRLPLFFPP
jgi:hypothetical protein